ncbi:hypothetical protein [Klebsiella pneumoniae]|uniref:hypothetical protein n=1 Tax=Klebsiella pneumoniae TaxID=573 RepID=UPI001BFE4B4D|nr:hypothetical protein [Klebsiella pneumoniae]
MGITLYTNNAFSSISDPDSYSPGFDTTLLRRAEIFTYTGIGSNLMPGEGLPSVAGTPSIIDGTPFAQFANNVSIAHLNLGIQDSEKQTWFIYFNPNSDPTQRLIMSSYGGTSPSNLPGAGIMVSAAGTLQLGLGYHDTTTDAYSVSFATLGGGDLSKPALLCVTLNDATATIEDLTHGLSASVTLTTGRVRAPNTIRVGKGAVSLWGSAAATSQIGAYFVFDRVLSVDEKTSMREYIRRCIQAKFPAEIL